jgi:hypothetical protein
MSEDVECPWLCLNDFSAFRLLTGMHRMGGMGQAKGKSKKAKVTASGRSVPFSIFLILSIPV